MNKLSYVLSMYRNVTPNTFYRCLEKVQLSCKKLSVHPANYDLHLACLHFFLFFLLSVFKTKHVVTQLMVQHILHINTLFVFNIISFPLHKSTNVQHVLLHQVTGMRDSNDWIRLSKFLDKVHCH